MAWLVTKYFATAAVVVLVSEIARRSGRLGALVGELPMFLAFPALLPRIGFWPALAACVLITIVSFVLFALIVRRFGIELP